jgi:hypothetical protein
MYELEAIKREDENNSPTVRMPFKRKLPSHLKHSRKVPAIISNLHSLLLS